MLRIVRGFHDDEEAPMEGIRLERTGRSEGGSGLAGSVSLLADRIGIELTDSRRKTPGFDESVVESRFRKDQDGTGELRAALLDMESGPNGFRIDIV